MACANLTDIIRSCESTNIGGVSQWYAVPKEDIETFTIVNNVVTVLTLKATKKFYAIQIEPNLSSATSELVKPNRFYRETCVMVIMDDDSDVLGTIDNLNKGQFVIIALLENGSRKVFGLSDSIATFPNSRAMEATTSAYTTGVADADAASHTVTLVGKRNFLTPFLGDGVVIDVTI
jgi:hypothetical protein